MYLALQVKEVCPVPGVMGEGVLKVDFVEKSFSISLKSGTGLQHTFVNDVLHSFGSFPAATLSCGMQRLMDNITVSPTDR